MRRRDNPWKDPRDGRAAQKKRSKAHTIESSDEDSVTNRPSPAENIRVDGDSPKKRSKIDTEVTVYPETRHGIDSGSDAAADGPEPRSSPSCPDSSMPRDDSGPPTSTSTSATPFPTPPPDVPPMLLASSSADTPVMMPSKPVDIERRMEIITPRWEHLNEQKTQGDEHHTDDNSSVGYSTRAYNGSASGHSRQGSGDSTDSTASLHRRREQERNARKSDLEKDTASFFNNYHLSSDYPRSPERKDALHRIDAAGVLGGPPVPAPPAASVPRYSEPIQFSLLRLDETENYFPTRENERCP